MKTKSIISIWALGLLAWVNFSCEDAKNGEVDNLIYFSEAASAKTKTLSLEEGGTTTSVTVRLARAIDTDVNVTIGLDEALLDDFNKQNETDYKILESGKYTLSNTATIKAGSISSEPIGINIESFDTYGVQYAIPLTINSANSGIEKAQASSKIILFLVQPLKQPVPKFTWYNAMRALPKEDWRMELPNYTLEWWCKITAKNGTGGFTKNNQAIFNSGGADAEGKGIELYIRFGDLIYAESGKYKNNFLQVKTFGSQFDTGDPTAGYGLDAQQWYHFAITYDAGTGVTLIYKNGEQVASLTTSAGQSMWVDKLQMISSGSEYFPDFCEMCQVRMWKTTRTGNQVKKNMYNDLDPKNPDLILYIPMDEGEGTILHDITGNGHDVEIGNDSSASNATSVTWANYTFAQ